MAYFILNDDRFEILDRIVEVIVSETHSGRIYLHIRRHRTRAVGVNVETDEALVELYESTSGASRCIAGPVERWARRIVEGTLKYNPYDDAFELIGGTSYLAIVPDEARGIRPPREIPAVDGYVPMAWKSPHTRKDVFFYEHVDLGKPTATVFVRARRSDPLALWKRVEAAVQDIFDVGHVYHTRAGWGHEIFTLWPPVRKRAEHTIRLLGSTWRVWPVPAHVARRLNLLAEQLPLETAEDIDIQYALTYIGDQLCGLVRRRGWYVVQRID